jgi:histidinol phosphatase-like PHP family hydrolase
VLKRLLLCSLVLTGTGAGSYLFDVLAAEPSKPAEAIGTNPQMLQFQREHFPVVNFHVHLKGGLTLDQALEQARNSGVKYGIAVNCGLGFSVTNDAGINSYLDTMKGKPVFVGMQAEGREWVRLFSQEAMAKFDYVFTDSMTFTDDSGKRMRLWINDEVEVKDKQAFLDMLVSRILGIMNNEPIDIYVNPTFLPDCIAKEYDTLWTQERMQKVIAAAAKNGVAIEINARYRLPSPAFIKLAKQAGVKFSFGTNNADRDVGSLDYCLAMVQECGLTPQDMFMPKSNGQKPVQTRPGK